MVRTRLNIGCRYSTPVRERPLHPTRGHFTPEPSQTQAPVTPATEPERRALSRGRLVSFEMGFLPRALDEVPEQRSRAPGRSGRFRFGLARMAFPAHLRDGFQRHRAKREPPRPPASVLQQDIAPPAGGPDPNPKADKMIIPDRIFPLAGAETGDGAVGEPHAFPAGHGFRRPARRRRSRLRPSPFCRRDACT